MLFTLRIQLAHISRPPVWREIIVPGQFTFHKLHKIIQAAFGWKDYHLYQFSEKGYASAFFIGLPSDEDWGEVKDSRRIKLEEVFTTEGQKYRYIYDFGDDWLHNITVNKITNDNATHAGLIAGKGKCPPEDCGGPSGYDRLKEIIKDPKDREHKGMKKWLGVDTGNVYDPAFFDLDDAQLAVERI